jgi:hypothetical protein
MLANLINIALHKIIRNKKIILTIVLTLGCLNNKAQSVEYHLKASLIEKFARYTEWESNTDFTNFTICIIGKSPFNGELEKMAEKTHIKEKPVKITYANSIDDINHIQVLFICKSERKQCSDIIKSIENKNIMIVGDTKGYAELGVHFNFYLKQNHSVHFEVNPKALRKSRLKTDLQLLNIGKVIDN